MTSLCPSSLLTTKYLSHHICFALSPSTSLPLIFFLLLISGPERSDDAMKLFWLSCDNMSTTCGLFVGVKVLVDAALSVMLVVESSVSSSSLSTCSETCSIYSTQSLCTCRAKYCGPHRNWCCVEILLTRPSPSVHLTLFERSL